MAGPTARARRSASAGTVQPFPGSRPPSRRATSSQPTDSKQPQDRDALPAEVAASARPGRRRARLRDAGTTIAAHIRAASSSPRIRRSSGSSGVTFS